MFSIVSFPSICGILLQSHPPQKTEETPISLIPTTL